MIKAKEGEREELLKLKQNQEQYYNRTAQDLKTDLKTDMKVYVQLQPQSRDWKPGTILECLDYNKF